MTPEIKAVRERFERNRLDLLNLIPEGDADKLAKYGTTFSLLALMTIKDLLDTLCKEP